MQTFTHKGSRLSFVEGGILGKRHSLVTSNGRKLVMVDIAPSDGSPHVTAYIEA